MKPLYLIANWDARFENSHTRKLKKISWFHLSNCFDDDDYLELIHAHQDGPAHYAAWIAMIQLASRCTPRGALLKDDRRPHDCNSLEKETKIPARIYRAVIPRLMTLGWLHRLTPDLSDLNTQKRSEFLEMPEGRYFVFLPVLKISLDD